MAEHVVRWICIDEGSIGVDGNMGDSWREGRIIRNENYVIYGVVIKFVSSATVMCSGGPTITDWESGADRMEDVQVGWLGRVDVRYLDRGVAVPSPEALQGSHHHTIGS